MCRSNTLNVLRTPYSVLCHFSLSPQAENEAERNEITAMAIFNKALCYAVRSILFVKCHPHRYV